MDRCAYDDPSYLPSRVMERAAEETTQVWDDGIHTELVTVRRARDGP